MVGAGVEAGWSTITGAAASPAGCGGSETVVSSALEPPCWSGSEAGAMGSEAFESMLVRDVSAGGTEVRNAGLSGREPRSDEGRESERSLALLTALARRSWSREFGLLRDGFREASGPLASTELAATSGLWGYPPASTTSFLSTAAAALSVPSALAAPSVAAAGLGPVEPSSARIVSSRDSRPERALFHQPLPLMLFVFYFFLLICTWNGSACCDVAKALLAFTVHSSFARGGALLKCAKRPGWPDGGGGDMGNAQLRHGPAGVARRNGRECWILHQLQLLVCVYMCMQYEFDYIQVHMYIWTVNGRRRDSCPWPLLTGSSSYVVQRRGQSNADWPAFRLPPSAALPLGLQVTAWGVYVDCTWTCTVCMYTCVHVYMSM